MISIKKTVLIASLLLGLPVVVSAQIPEASAGAEKQEAKEAAIGLAPARFELPMMPGTERTVVVNIIYSSGGPESQPCRLVATLADWSILPNGNVDYAKAGTMQNSAANWMLYSPGEVTAMPGKIHPIRITISVPKDAAPGDHLAALIVEQRPDNIKLDENRRQVVLRFRMAALFYISVPKLTRKGSLENLKAETVENGLLLTATIKNDGNTHLRPVYSVQVLNNAGAVVADLPESESIPVLGGAELSAPIFIEKRLPAGNYSVRYRVDFRDGTATTEGQVELQVGAARISQAKTAD